MKQLSGLDAGFLYMETPTTFGHISSVSIYRRPRSKDFNPYQLFRSRVSALLPDLEPFRRRLVEVPFQMDHPWWIEDPNFDLDFHVRHIAVPSPGGDNELADLVSRIIARPLDRARPLWEAYVIEGLAGNRWAVLLKVHHATIDGASGTELLTTLLDTKPSKKLPVPENEPTTATESVPDPGEMMIRTAANFVMRPERLLRAQARALRDFTNIASQQDNPLLFAGSAGLLGNPNRRRDNDAMPRAAAPATPFNQSISASRRVSLRSTSLSDVKTVKKALGVTVNDVVMAVCAGALRRYLQKHDVPVDRPLVTMVPVSIRNGEEVEKWTNRISSIFAPLPVHLDDPLERLAATNEAMVGAKSTFDMVPADALQNFSNYSPPAVFTQAAALASRLKIANRLASPVNLVISNVPGPREPLYLGSARLEHFYPVSTIGEGMGLNITVQSYEDKLDYGLVSCRDLLPDLDELMDFLIEEQALLLELATQQAAAEQTVADSAELATLAEAEEGATTEAQPVG